MLMHWEASCVVEGLKIQRKEVLIHKRCPRSYRERKKDPRFMPGCLRTSFRFRIRDTYSHISVFADYGKLKMPPPMI